MKKRPGDRAQVRYIDRAWYPAIVVSVSPRFVVRWDPPDPNIPPTFVVDDPDEDVR